MLYIKSDVHGAHHLFWFLFRVEYGRGYMYYKILLFSIQKCCDKIRTVVKATSYTFRRSSAVEHSTVNRLVVGSNPTGGAL